MRELRTGIREHEALLCTGKLIYKYISYPLYNTLFNQTQSVLALLMTAIVAKPVDELTEKADDDLETAQQFFGGYDGGMLVNHILKES